MVETNWLPTSSSRRWRSLRRPSSTNVLNFVRKTSPKRRPGEAGRPCNKMPAALFAAIMERDQDISAMMFAEQPILDLGRRHGDERLRVSLPGHAIRRSIQYSGQLAIGREDRRCDAGEIVVARKKVLAPVHDNRALEMCRGAKAVGAANAFRPNSTRPDARRVRSVAEARVGYYVEQQSICVRKRNHEIGTGDLLMQRVHLSEREATDQRTTLLFLAQDCRADKLGRRRAQRVEAERNAAHPAIVDIGRQKFGWRRSALLKRRPCILDAPAGRQHHRSSLN